MSCVYTYNGNDYSYSGILEAISNVTVTKNYILYSVASEQDLVIDTLNNIRNTSSIDIPEKLTFRQDCDSENLTSSNSKMHILTFLNNPNLFIDENSSPYLVQLNDEQYKEVLRGQMRIINPSLTDSDINKQVDLRFSNYELQGIDGYIIHTLLNSSKERLEDDVKFNSELDRLIDKYKDEPKVVNRIQELKKDTNFKQKILLLHDSISITRHKDSKVVFQLPISGKLNVNGKMIDVYDIIDQVVVQSDGTIHIYKIKVSEQPKSSWSNIKANSSPKVERYRYELNLIKALLEDKGIRGNKVQLHILGVSTEYSTDNTANIQLKDISDSVEDIQMDINRSTLQTSKHYEIATKFVNPKTSANITNEVIDRANTNIGLLFPNTGIQLSMLKASVAEWIKYNKHRIRRLESSTYAYELYYPGHEVIRIKDDSEIENNLELQQALEKLLKKSAADNEFIISSLQSTVTEVFKTGNFNFRTKAFSNCEDSIKQVLLPYINDSYLNDQGEREFNWQLVNIPELLDLGIIMVKNKNNNQVDIISLTNIALNLPYKFDNNNQKTTLAGGYCYDIDSRGVEQANTSTIQASKVLMLINELAPQLSDVQFGNLVILSTYHSGQSRFYNIQDFVHKNLSPLIQIARDNNQGVTIQNNMAKHKGVNYLDQLLARLKSLLNNGRYIEVPHIKETVTALNNATTDSEKIKLLTELANDFMYATGLTGKTLESWANEVTIRGNNGNYTMYIGKLIADALTQLKSYEVFEPRKLTQLQKFMPIRSVNSNNAKAVFKLYSEYSDQINNEAYKEGLTINKICQEYYKAKGYSGKFVGNQTQQFTSLFVTDNKGNIDSSMRLKNAWDQSEVLQSYERKFIKQFVFLITKYRYQNKGLDFKFSSWDSKEFADFVQKNQYWVLCVPLMKASGSSKLQTGYAFKDTFTRIQAFIKEPALYAKEVIESKAIWEELNAREIVNDVWVVSPHNYFQYAEPEIKPSNMSADTTNREQALSNHEDPRYFETNLEDIMRDFSMETVRSQNMRRFMIASKLFCLKMYFTKNQLNSKDIENELNTISDFIKVNVFGQPLVEADSYGMANFIMKARRFVSNLFIAGNVAGAVRDTFEGFQQIMVKAISKEDPTLKVDNIVRAYGIVVNDMMTKPEVASLISQLCIKYRMSNIDVSNVAEGMKSGKGGIFHFDNEMYKTLRTPDFLNRMVFFVAKAINDGVWGAISLDKNGLIKYDWKKDRRFNLVATNNQNNREEYLKQKGLFIAYIKLWNQEHPEAILENYDNLPMPYSQQEMTQIHAEADRIWGSYDKSTKPLGEHMMVGLAFGMFMTWMSGQIEWYFRGTQTSMDTFKWQQAVDDATGQLLWLDKDGGVTTENTGEPCYVRVPIMVQGIVGTLKQMWRVLNTEGETWKTHVFNNDQNVLNMVKLRNDVIVSLIYLALIKVALQAWREHQKDVTDPHDLITNSLCEILYKGMYNSWDGFKGPLNIITFLGEQVNPPFYTESLAIAKDLFRTTVGDMTILSFGSRHLAPIRSIRESIKAYETGKQPS